MKATRIFSVLSTLVLILSAASLQASACEDDVKATQSSATSKEPTLSLTESGPQKAVFQVSGIMCKSCEKKIQAALKGVQGVKSVTFLKAGSKDGARLAQVTFENGSKVSPESLTQAVAGAGFKATITQ